MSTELLIAIGVGVGLLLLVVGGAAVLIRMRRRALPDEDEPAAALPAAEEPAPAPPAEGLLGRLRQGLSRTKGQLVSRLDELLTGESKVDEALLGQLEEVMISADVGVRTVSELLDGVRKEMRAHPEGLEPAAVRAYLQQRVSAILADGEGALAEVAEPPLVIMIVGVNGSGKTTTIGKLASRYTAQGKKVMLAAADTFRAAAIDQLEIWGERADAEVIRRDEGADPASVVHDAISAATSRGADVLIADTAGRLHTKLPLMEELEKVKRVMGKKVPGAPHETLLVVDANNGQNAIAQASNFQDAVGLTGIVLTKLDGTAKGGVIVGVIDQLGIPIKLIGIGEQVDDLRDFVAADFVDALFELGEGGNGPPAEPSS